MITKFKLFESNVDDPYNEEDWSNNDEFIQKLYDISMKVDDEGSSCHTIYLKTPVVIGTKDGQVALCNYYYSNNSNVVFHILFDEKSSNIYDREYNFTYVTYDELIANDGLVTHRHRGEGEKWQFNLEDDFVEKIYNEVNQPGYDKWLSEIEEMKKFNREFEYLHDSTWPHIKWSKLPYKDRIQHLRNKIKLSYLVNRHNFPGDEKRLHDMETMTEKEFNDKEEKQAAMIRKILKK